MSRGSLKFKLAGLPEGEKLWPAEEDAISDLGPLMFYLILSHGYPNIMIVLASIAATVTAGEKDRQRKMIYTTMVKALTHAAEVSWPGRFEHDGDHGHPQAPSDREDYMRAHDAAMAFAAVMKAKAQAVAPKAKGRKPPGRAKARAKTKPKGGKAHKRN